MPRLTVIICLSLILTLGGCNRPSSYKHSTTYGRIVEDNDSAYIPPAGYRPKIRLYPRDNDATYIPPRGRLARTPRPYPRDNDAAYIYPRGYRPGRINGNGHGYPRDNDAYYTYPRGYDDGDGDMLDIYPLYLD